MATVAQKLANLSHAAERQVFSVAIESFLKKLNSSMFMRTASLATIRSPLQYLSSSEMTARLLLMQISKHLMTASSLNLRKYMTLT